MITEDSTNDLSQMEICSSINFPIEDEKLWENFRKFAKLFSEQGLVDPISFLHGLFKHVCSSTIPFSSFVQWFLSDEENRKNFQINLNRVPNFQTSIELNNAVNILPPVEFDGLDRFDSFDEIWFLFCVSTRFQSQKYSSQPEIVIFDPEAMRRTMSKRRTVHTSLRIYCYFALTPSGRFSNQLYYHKSGRKFNISSKSNSFARVCETTNEGLDYDHLQTWLEDFLKFQRSTKSVLVLDPRTKFLPKDFLNRCENAAISLSTISNDVYLRHILNPIFTLFDKRWSEANLVEKMNFKSWSNIQRTIDTFWFCLRSLKRNDEIFGIFQKTKLWKNEDEKYFQSLRLPSRSSIINKIKKRKRPSTKIERILANKTKNPTVSFDSTPEEIFSQLFHRQIPIGFGSKLLGGIKLNYFKYCLSYKSDLPSINGSNLLKLNEFMQSKSTVQWLKELKRLNFSPCSQQLFLREIYQLTGLMARKRSMNTYGLNKLGSARSCDQQSPVVFWKAFEQIHDVHFPDEPIPTEKKWKNDLQQYLIDEQLHHKQPTLWTVDVFEFPLTKKCTILQLPEWNELRPANATAKVTILYGFSQDGQSTEPYFIFPKSFQTEKNEPSNLEFYNELGHLTANIFQSWLEKEFFVKISEFSIEKPVVLIICSRLPIVSSSVLASLHQHKIYPFGYPFSRTLPFRYLFERRVRNNRSTNMISELWKRTLLDQQRTHLLKGVDCSVSNIKRYFEYIWPFLIKEKRDEFDDEDEIENQTNKSFKEKCRRAFQQANILLSIDDPNQLVDQLRFLSKMIEKIRKSLQTNKIVKFKADRSPTEIVESSEASSGKIISDKIFSSLTSNSTSDKRFFDENDEPRSTKRLRSSSFCRSVETISFSNEWIPPSNQQIARINSQSSSIFQFLLLLIETISKSPSVQLTDEQYQWLHSTATSYHKTNEKDKLDLLIETARHVVQTNLVR